MKLFFRQSGQGRPLIILHGLFGSSDNWFSLAKVFAEHFTVYLVDQRNHGQSPQSDDFDYQLLLNEIDEIKWEDNFSISNQIFRINEIGLETKKDGKQYAVIKMEPHKQLKKAGDKYLAEGKFLKRSQSINAIKIRLDCLGDIIAKGEECF